MGYKLEEAKLSTASQLSWQAFSVTDHPTKGLCIICKSPDANSLLKELYGWSEEVPTEVMRSSDERTEMETYYSVIRWEGNLYVCFGLISLINHSCSSKVSLVTEPDNNLAKKKVLGTIAEVEEGEEWGLKVGDEVTIRYSDSFDLIARGE
jgi:hypothetical protein